MAQYPYRANLNSQSFPMLSRLQGQTVIVRGQDGNYIPSVYPKADAAKDVGIPQVYYCHNVLPTLQGYSAVGFVQKKEAFVGTVVFSKVLQIRDDDGNVASLGVAVNERKLYITKPGDSGWTEVSLPVTLTEDITYVTAAYVSGTTYVFVQGVGCFTYNFTTAAFTKVTMDGLDEEEIIGVVSTAGYLLAWSKNAIAWSSTLDPLDFVPDLSTGAGGGGVEGTRGNIVVCAPTAAGFIVYTAVNAVAAAYSGNSRYPFNFREIIGAGGVLDSETVASDGAIGLQYAYTSYGLQGISFQQAQIQMPEVTDFISGSYFEDFDADTDTFSYTDLALPMRKKLQLVAGRYLVLSYGVTSLTHALVYDLGLERMGKIRLPHVDVFDYAQAGNLEVESAKQSLAFLQADGTVKLATIDFGDEGDGVLIMGKYQINRTRWTQLEEVAAENVLAGANYSVEAWAEIDGEYTDKQVGYLRKTSGGTRVYNFSVVGENISLVHKGGFRLSSLVLDLHLHGRM